MGILRRQSGGKQIVLSTEQVVGRMASCGVSLDASFVSTTHALIRYNGGSWEVRDLGSRNGTYVDGVRAVAGDPVRLQRGATLMFGEATESWELVDDLGPTAVAIPLDGGEPCPVVSGVIGLPTPNEPLGMIFFDDGHWLLEIGEARTRLEAGQRFTLAEREWRFECPSGAVATVTSTERPWSLQDATLALAVSQNEEHVALRLKMGSSVKDLGERTCFYLALVLARRRLDDQRAGAREPGWVEVESLLRMVPDYSSDSHLTVDIFRLRKLLGQAGVYDAARIVERRRGEVRLGTDRVELSRG